MTVATETIVKERPIIFSAPMVRAILEGRKTQTRRVVKPQPGEYGVRPFFTDYRGIVQTWKTGPMKFPTGEGGPVVRCPYGAPGERLWVREAWGVESEDAHTLTDPEYLGGKNPDKLWFKATEKDPAIFPRGFWRSPIHMPRWASRIVLEIKGIRVERVQDIPEADAVAEGFHQTRERVGNSVNWSSAAGHFAGLWKKLHGPESWDSNPWVWVIEFKRIGGAA